MCGILGVSRMTEDTRRVIPWLIWQMEERGKDSWGATDGIHTVKHLGPATATWASAAQEVLGWDRCIIHTRAASTGSVSIENQHPFDFSRMDGDQVLHRVIGIHNGVVTNHAELDRKYKVSFDVDSMHIYHHLANGWKCDDICGWGALAWYDFTPSHPDGRLQLLRFNSDNLHVVQLAGGEAIFASTDAAIKRACEMAGVRIRGWYRIEPEILWYFERSEKNPAKDIGVYATAKLPFGGRGVSGGGYDWNGTCGRRVAAFTVHTGSTTEENRVKEINYACTWVGEDRRRWNMCLSSGCDTIINRRAGLICTKCLGKIHHERVTRGWEASEYVPA